MTPNQTKTTPFKVGRVAIIGRPNVGKSTLLNNLLKHKVSIISPRPQTTTANVEAYLETDASQIFFIDTPGYFRLKGDASPYNTQVVRAAKEADVVVYLVDHTKKIGDEELRLYNLVQQIDTPIIVAINKIDQTEPSYLNDYYALLEDTADSLIQISAIRGTNLNLVIEAINHYIPEGERRTVVDHFETPLLSHSAKQFITELVREKIFQHTGQEVPYKVTPQIDAIEEKADRLQITGHIIVPHARYKGMLIGKGGRKINQITDSLVKELTVATGKQVSVSLKVTD